MSWNSEFDFVNMFINSYSLFSNNNRYSYKVWNEFKTGYGRPDIAIIQYDNAILSRVQIERGNKNLKSLSTKAVYAMSFLTSRRWISIERLGKNILSEGIVLNRIISELNDRGLIEKKDNLIKARSRSEVLAVRKIWVFEAKLNDWKGAIDQAERNLWFTNDSYVLMPDKSIELTDSIINECSKRGVGLSFFNSQNSYKNVLRPSRTGLVNTPLLWSINERIMEDKDD